MIRAHNPAKWLFLAILALTASLGIACLDESPVLKPSEAESDEARIQECREILGKAFASPEQRQWFIDNCSSWPQRDVPETVASDAPSPVPNDTPECAAMRGKPYESAEQRQWFLANCIKNGDAQVRESQPSQPVQPASSGEGDRTNCQEIGGTQYRSATERQWFQANCLANVNVQDDDDDDGNGNENGNRNRGNGNGREDRDDD